MSLLSFLRKPNPARELALIGAEKRKREVELIRRTVLEVAREMRREKGLPEDPRLNA